MAVVAKIDGRPLLNVKSYSVDEDSTSVDLSDESGGTAQINLTVPVWPGWKASRGKVLELSDDTQGKTFGKINAISEDRGIVSITAGSRILSLSGTRQAQPFSGTLAAAIRYYLSLVGITDKIVIDDAIGASAVQFPGWNGDVYQQVARKLCPAWGLELALVGENIVFRPPRTRRAVVTRAMQMQQSIDDGDRSQKVRSTWYRTERFVGQIVYPPDGYNADVETFDVGASEVKVIDDVPLNASLYSITQPICVQNVGPEYDFASVYTVAGNDGLPVTPSTWKAFGGDLKVEINPDTRSLKITITGMSFASLAPFTIAVASGPSDFYPTLRIVGDGIRLNATEMIRGTGLTEADAPEEFGDDVDNEFVNSYAQAHRLSSWHVGSAGGPQHTLSIQAAGINRASDSGSYNYATFDDFDRLYAGMTFDQFDAVWAGKTHDDFEAFWAAEAASDFTNQAFGNIAGSRVYHDDSIFRIRTASNAQGVLSGSAEADNTFDDFDAFYAGMTFDQFDAMWAGRTVDEYDVGPFPGLR